jgi:hypothetical protein
MLLTKATLFLSKHARLYNARKQRFWKPSADPYQFKLFQQYNKNLGVSHYMPHNQRADVVTSDMNYMASTKLYTNN